MAKETRLGENAEIYAKRPDKTEKEKFSELNTAGKFQYFRDYYLAKIIVVLFAAGLLIYLGYTMFLKPKIDTVLYMAVLNDSYTEENQKKLETDLSIALELDPEKQELFIDANYFGGEDNFTVQQKLLTYIYAGTVDILLGDEEQMADYARKGMLVDLAELIPTDVYGKLTDSIFMEKREEDTREKAYGVYLGESERYKSLGGTLEKPVIGILENTGYRDNAVSTILYFFGY